MADKQTYSKLSAVAKQPFERRTRNFIYTDLRGGYTNGKRMVEVLAKCIFDLEQLAAGEVPIQCTHKNILEMGAYDFPKITD